MLYFKQLSRHYDLKNLAIWLTNNVLEYILRKRPFLACSCSTKDHRRLAFKKDHSVSLTAEKTHQWTKIPVLGVFFGFSLKMQLFSEKSNPASFLSLTTSMLCVILEKFCDPF